MSSQPQGTICDAPNFNAVNDAELLKKAMKGMGTNEHSITYLLGNRSNKQRQMIKKEFAQMFGKDLIKELKSELSGNYEETVLALMMPSIDYDAYQCYKAMDGIGTDEACLIEIFCSRSNAKVHALREAYKRIYKKDLAEAIKSETSGHFKRILYSLVQGHRKENEPVDIDKAVADARALYDAGEARWGTDEPRFNVVLASRSFEQLRLIIAEYEKISNCTLEEAIENEMSGDLMKANLSIVQCAKNVPAFYAEQLYRSMKGLGTNDRKLIRIMVSRSEIDMRQIKQEFHSKYKDTLESFIRDDTTGDYKKLLVQLCKGNNLK